MAINMSKTLSMLKGVFTKPKTPTTVSSGQKAVTSAQTHTSSTAHNKNLNRNSNSNYAKRAQVVRQVLNDLMSARNEGNMKISNRKFNNMVRNMVESIDNDPTILSNERKFNKLMDTISGFQATTNAAVAGSQTGQQALRNEQQNKKQQSDLDDLMNMIENGGSTIPGGSNTVIG